MSLKVALFASTLRLSLWLQSSAVKHLVRTKNDGVMDFYRASANVLLVIGDKVVEATCGAFGQIWSWHLEYRLLSLWMRLLRFPERGSRAFPLSESLSRQKICSQEMKLTPHV